jgi:hypothetical protein
MMPPVSANGMPVNTSSPSLTLLNMANSSMKTSSSATGTTICRRLVADCRLLEGAAPGGPVAGGTLIACEPLFGLGDEGADVPPAHIGTDHDAALAVLPADLVGAGARFRVAISPKG